MYVCMFICIHLEHITYLFRQKIYNYLLMLPKSLPGKGYNNYTLKIDSDAELTIMDGIYLTSD